MKKFLSILALVLVVAMCASFAVSAAPIEKTITSATGSEQQNISLTYNAATDDTTAVTSVDVVWDGMEFVYNAGTNKWNPESHAYDISNNDGAWTDSTATVKVTNHSNKDVNVKVEYTQNSTTKVAATVSDNGTATLESAVGKTVENAATKTFTITASGAPTKSGTTAGIAKVTLS